MNKIKNNNWKIYMLTVISFIVGTTQFCIVGMLDKIAASVGISVSTAGQLVTVYALANAIGTPIVVVAISKMNQRKKLLLSLSIIISGIAIMLVLPGFTSLLVARMVLGIGAGVFIVNAYGTATKLAEAGRQGSAMSNVAIGFSSSLVFGVPLGRMIEGAYGWKSIFLIIEILCLISLFIIKKSIPAFEGESSIPLKDRFTLLKNPKIALMLSVTLFVFIGFSIIDTYITPFLLFDMPNMESKISIILMVLGVGSLIGSKLGGVLADKIGIAKTIFASIIIQGIALILVSLTPGWIGGGIALLMIWECACWTFGPTQNFNMVSLSPEVSSIALSLNSTFVQIGFSLGSGIGGAIIGRWSVMSITWVSAISALVAVVIFAYIHFQKTKKLI